MKRRKTIKMVRQSSIKKITYNPPIIRSMAKVEQTPTQGAEMTTEERFIAPLSARGLLLDDQTPADLRVNKLRKN